MSEQRDKVTGQQPGRAPGQELNRPAEREQSRSTGQQQMEAHVEKTLHENNVLQEKTLNGLMKCSKASCSYEDRTMTFEFPLQDWQANRVGSLHGGMICTAFDLTIAALARFYARENFAPTVSLNVNYVRPARIGDTLVVEAKAIAAGKRITQLTAEARSGETGKLIAAATSVYMNVDTAKEHSEAREHDSGQPGPETAAGSAEHPAGSTK